MAAREASSRAALPADPGDKDLAKYLPGENRSRMVRPRQARGRAY